MFFIFSNTTRLHSWHDWITDGLENVPCLCFRECGCACVRVCVFVLVRPIHLYLFVSHLLALMSLRPKEKVIRTINVETKTILLCTWGWKVSLLSGGTILQCSKLGYKTIFLSSIPMFSNSNAVDRTPIHITWVHKFGTNLKLSESELVTLIRVTK